MQGLVGTAIWLAALSVTCVSAAVYAERRERHAAAVVALSWIASLSAQAASAAPDPNLLFTVIDGAALMLLFGLVWKAGRLWPLAAVSFQGLALAVDVVRMISPLMPAPAYLGGLAVAGWGVLGSVAVGVSQAAALRRRLRLGLVAANG